MPRGGIMSTNEKIIDHFPGYEFVLGDDNKMHNMYRGTDLSLGGYVYSEPGMYYNVALLDAASLHPSSIILLNKLGEYTPRYADLKNARVLIKHRDYEGVSKLFEGKLTKYLKTDEDADKLSKVLKYPLNAFFGISFGKFNTAARDRMDKNNIIALRGSLFMKTLQDAIEEQGFHVVHVKTDSVKIPNATDEIVKFVQDFGKKYGYEMEHEATYDRMCLVNKAVYIAKYDDHGIRNKGGKHANEWTATGTQFQVPYVFKTLFTHEEIVFRDLCETKSVSSGGSIYLNFNEDMIGEYILQLRELEEELMNAVSGKRDIKIRIKEIKEKIDQTYNLRFVGRCGLFTPVLPGQGGGILIRSNSDETSYSAVTGTTGYRWMESEVIEESGKYDIIDRSYFRSLVDEAYDEISKYGDAEAFINS